ncbi:MAG: hypothetical protein REI95_00335 [Oxalicibacterium faecigallinarum]|uniref:hypothetical protein n=1 Tax=Oxalicibacterium faecigallinarum TaxID=573741 RepID=UPI0028085315|nr:hypothetical protein [Oxalicibacterium faecigallinarum]MDQ7968067.1 hypothetical protein [Oxalicibacterium faecigallinarum]
MAKETLDLDKLADADRRLGTGHGTGALGPSDRSDSGSDMAGLTDFDSDTDSNGTGERASVNMRETGEAEDIDTDRIDINLDDDQEGESVVPAGRTKPEADVEV